MACGVSESAMLMRRCSLHGAIHQPDHRAGDRLFDKIFWLSVAECSGVSELNSASGISGREQSDRRQQVCCRSARSGCGPRKIRAGHVMQRPDVPPNRVKSLKGLAAAAPYSQRQGEAWNEQRPRDPCQHCGPICSEQQANASSRASGDCDQDTRRPYGWQLPLQ